MPSTKEIANALITHILNDMSDYLISEGNEHTFEIANVGLTYNFKGEIKDTTPVIRYEHEHSTFKTILDSVYVTEFWSGDDLNEKRRLKLNELLNEKL